MTTPDVPLRLELTVEVPGTPSQVWDAVATARGISAWFLPTDLDEREGGTIVTHMGEDASSAGTVTGYEAPRRFRYEEPDWAALSGHDGAPVTPLATEFLVEARAGGTCVVRVVSSSFGTGADWENEFFGEMERMWMPFFERLRLYLAHFPGQQVTTLEASVSTGEAGLLNAALRRALGASQPGDRVEVRGLTGEVVQVDEVQLLVRLTGPVPGFVAFVVFGTSPTTAQAAIQGYLFGADAPAYVEREQQGWQEWLQSLGLDRAAADR